MASASITIKRSSRRSSGGSSAMKQTPRRAAADPKKMKADVKADVPKTKPVPVVYEAQKEKPRQGQPAWDGTKFAKDKTDRLSRRR
jgi:hypothetical protein